VFYQKGSSGHPSRHHNNRVCVRVTTSKLPSQQIRKGSGVTLKQIEQEERERETEMTKKKNKTKSPSSIAYLYIEAKPSILISPFLRLN